MVMAATQRCHHECCRCKIVEVLAVVIRFLGVLCLMVVEIFVGTITAGP